MSDFAEPSFAHAVGMLVRREKRDMRSTTLTTRTESSGTAARSHERLQRGRVVRAREDVGRDVGGIDARTHLLHVGEMAARRGIASAPRRHPNRHRVRGAFRGRDVEGLGRADASAKIREPIGVDPGAVRTR